MPKSDTGDENPFPTDPRPPLPLGSGAGSDPIHRDPIYSYAVTELVFGVYVIPASARKFPHLEGRTAHEPSRSEMFMKRHGMITALHPDKVDEYKRLHAAVWPEVLEKITECNIRNYSIYLREIPGIGPLLFSYFEYVGEDFEADMRRMAADPATQRWWEFCKPCQKPVAETAVGDTWAAMSEVFHHD